MPNIDPKDVTYLYFETNEDYYFIDKQLQIKDDRRFSDKGDPSSITDLDQVVGFFSTTRLPKSGSSRPTTAWVPSWQQTEQYLTSSTSPQALVGYGVDFFRNGVEMMNLQQWAAGYAKLSAGTPGHIIDNPACIGSLISNDNIGHPWFKDLNSYSPIEYISTQNSGGIPNITFPIIINEAEETDKNGFNGTLEIFTIRDVVNLKSISSPYEPRSTKGSFGNGNQRSIWDGSDDVVTLSEFDVSDTETPYTDDFDFELGYFRDAANHVLPFSDFVYARDHADESKYDADLLSVVRQMSPLGTTYIREKEQSQACGFVYDNAGLTGTDSVAFGGLLY